MELTADLVSARYARAIEFGRSSSSSVSWTPEIISRHHSARMARLEIDYFVLDALANDLEGLADILRLVNHPTIGWHDRHGGEIGRAEIILALNRLIADGLVQGYQLDDVTGSLMALPGAGPPAASLADLYFGLTAHGRLVHANWEPETETP